MGKGFVKAEEQSDVSWIPLGCLSNRFLDALIPRTQNHKTHVQRKEIAQDFHQQIEPLLRIQAVL